MKTVRSWVFTIAGAALILLGFEGNLQMHPVAGAILLGSALLSDTLLQASDRRATAERSAATDTAG
jgi:hypothetical protein